MMWGGGCAVECGGETGGSGAAGDGCESAWVDDEASHQSGAGESTLLLERKDKRSQMPYDLYSTNCGKHLSLYLF